MSPIDNVPFQIHSFDAAEGFLVDGNPLGFAAKLQVEGNISGGGIVSFIGDFDGLNDGAGVGIDFQTFVLPSTFTNLSSVTFRGLTTSGDPGAALFSVDNLAVAAVPIPSALLLFTSGLLSFVCSHRRRRSLTKCAA